MENKDLNKRVLERLEQKIAIEEFKKESENINMEKQTKKPLAFLKVASLLIVASLVAGNAYTYATYDTNIFSYALDKLGIFSNKESVIKINEEKQDTNASLTLENYAMDQESLLIGYRLKFKEKPEYFLETLFEDTKITDNNDVYALEKNSSSSFYKINDLEYEIFKVYEIDANNFSDNAILSTDITLYKELDGPIADDLGNWEFEIKLDKSKINSNYEKYLVENKNVVLDKILVNEKTSDMVADVSLIEVHQSDLATKFIFEMGWYFTNVEYFIEIEDENGNKILEDNIQTIVGGDPCEIVVGKISLDSKVKINIYEKGYFEMEQDKKVLSKGSIEIDLSKELKETEERKISYEEKTWKDLTIKYDNTTEIEENEYEMTTGNKYQTLSLVFAKYIGNAKSSFEYGRIICMKNLYNDSLEKVANDLRKLALFGRDIIDTEYTEYLVDKDGDAEEEIVFTHEELLKFYEDRKITINGREIKEEDMYLQEREFEDIKQIKIDGIDAITWKEHYGEDINNVYIITVNDNIYVISLPTSLELKDMLKQFVEDIKVNK